MKSKIMLEHADVEAIATACRSEAERLGLSVSIALVDDGGHPLRLERMDGVSIATPSVATAKARTAVFLRGPTAGFAERVRTQPELLRLEEYMPMPGGLPVMVDGQCIGGLGISGARPDQDEEIAAAGIRVASARAENRA